MVAARVAGQGGGGDAALLHGLGLIGALILYFVNKRREKAESTLKAATPQWDLDAVLAENPKNFEVRFSSVVRVALEKPGTWDQMKKGSHVANLNFELAQPAKPLTLAIKTAVELAACRAALGVALGSQLQIDAKLGGVQLAV